MTTAPPVKGVASSSNLLTQQEAQENMDVLQSQVESWLAVLFNVYSSVGRDSRGMVGDVINSWVSIAGEQVRLPFFFRSSFLK
jgi:ribosomal RNA-processing protein 12